MKKLLSQLCCTCGISLSLFACSTTNTNYQLENKVVNLNLNCTTGELCDVKLPSNTQVNSIVTNDSVRWRIEKNYTGSGDSTVTHISIKPLYPNLTNTTFVYSSTGLYVISTYSLSESEGY